MLSYARKQAILKSFPTKIELCYGSVVHHKVHSSEYNRIIPKGKKYFMYLHKHDAHINAYFLETSKKKMEIVDIVTYDVCMDHTLTCGQFGTVCYGTIFNSNKLRCFTIEDVMYYKSERVCHHPWNKKFSIMSNIMKHMQQIQYTDRGIVVGIPVMSNDNVFIQQMLQNLPYQVYSTEHISNRSRNYKITLTQNDCAQHNRIQNNRIQNNRIQHNRIQHNRTVPSNNSAIRIFNIRASIKNDIYHVLCEENDIGMACIPDYTTSVLMNTHFRRIKENTNLDLLEESDDEEEFEQMNCDKFVCLDKVEPFECKYHRRFRMWIPIKKAELPCSFTQYNDIKHMHAK